MFKLSYVILTTSFCYFYVGANTIIMEITQREIGTRSL